MNILLVSITAPWPTSNGGQQRTCLLHQALTLCGQVELLVLDSPRHFDADAMAQMKERFGLLDMAPVSMARPSGMLGRIDPQRFPRMGQLAHNLDGSRSRLQPDSRLMARLSRWIRQPNRYDLIVGRYSRSLARLGLVDTGVATILDVDDLDSETYRSRQAAARSGLARRILGFHAGNIEQREQALFQALDWLWVANPDNLSATPVERSSVLPNIPFIDPATPANAAAVADGCDEIMTIGSYRHPANVQGVDRFVQEVWPGVRRQRPQARFVIYGSGLAARDQARWNAVEGVSAPGFIQTTSDAYARCALAVCPVISGAGTNIKVLEAGANLRQCVLTRMAARGFDKDPELHRTLCIAENADEMVRQIVELLSDSENNRRQAAAFKAAVDAHYSRDRFNRIVADTVTRVVNEPRSCQP